MATVSSPVHVLQAIESYLATRVTRGDPDAKSLHLMLLPLLASPTQDASQTSALAFEEILTSMADAGAFDAEADAAISAHEKHFAVISQPFGIKQAREGVVQRLMTSYRGLPIADRSKAEARQRQALVNVDVATETLIARLDHSGSLESEDIQRSAYELRLAVAVASGDAPRAEVAYKSLVDLNYGNVREVEVIDQYTALEEAVRPTPPGKLLSRGWTMADDYTRDVVQDSVFMRTFGGYHFTIAQADNGDWIPVHGSRRMPPQVSAEAAADALLAYWVELPNSHKHMTDPESERLSADRVANLPLLQKQAGAAFTLYQVATKALQEVDGDAKEVNWDKVHHNTAFHSVCINSQPIDAVRKVLFEHSPGAVSHEQKHLLDQLILAPFAETPVVDVAVQRQNNNEPGI